MVTTAMSAVKYNMQYCFRCSPILCKSWPQSSCVALCTIRLPTSTTLAECSPLPGRDRSCATERLNSFLIHVSVQGLLTQQPQDPTPMYYQLNSLLSAPQAEFKSALHSTSSLAPQTLPHSTPASLEASFLQGLQSRNLRYSSKHFKPR